MILGVVLQSIGANIQMFIAARFFIGFGVAVAHGAAPLLISELVHPQHRAIFTTIYNSTWYLGSVIAAWVTFGKFDQAQSSIQLTLSRDLCHSQRLGLENSLYSPGRPIRHTINCYLVYLRITLPSQY